jgi:hypothetical protein
MSTILFVIGSSPDPSSHSKVLATYKMNKKIAFDRYSTFGLVSHFENLESLMYNGQQDLPKIPVNLSEFLQKYQHAGIILSWPMDLQPGPKR